jgi:hypothetical protein
MYLDVIHIFYSRSLGKWMQLKKKQVHAVAETNALI